MFKHSGTPDNDHVLCLKFNKRESFTNKIVIYVQLQSLFVQDQREITPTQKLKMLKI